MWGTGDLLRVWGERGKVHMESGTPKVQPQSEYGPCSHLAQGIPAGVGLGWGVSQAHSQMLV